MNPEDMSIEEIEAEISRLETEPLRKLIEKARPKILIGMWELEKMENFKKYCNRPK